MFGPSCRTGRLLRITAVSRRNLYTEMQCQIQEGSGKGRAWLRILFLIWKGHLCGCGDESRGCHSCPVAASDPESRFWENPAPALPLQLAPRAREGKYLWLKQHEAMEVGILAWKHCVAKLPWDPERCSSALPLSASEFKGSGENNTQSRGIKCWLGQMRTHLQPLRSHRFYLLLFCLDINFFY